MASLVGLVLADFASDALPTKDGLLLAFDILKSNWRALLFYHAYSFFCFNSQAFDIEVLTSRQSLLKLSMEPPVQSKLKHLYVYSLSPNRQKAMAGLAAYVNLWVKSSFSIKTFIFFPVVMTAGYLVYWAQEDHIKRHRKGYDE
jgi:hypothetical protein